MSADRKVRINIETKGDSRGAKDVSRELEKIANSQEKIGAENVAFQDLDAALRKTTSTAKQATQGQQQLDGSRKTAVATLRQLEAAEQAINTARGNGVKGVRSLGTSVAQAGMQIQDFTVQVGAGTSALTALAQQGSQFLGIFGPGGAIAGAVLALGAITLKAFTDMGEGAEEAKKKAAAAAQELMDLAKSVGSEDFAKFSDELERIAAGQSAIYEGTIGQNEALRDQAQAQSEIEKGWRKAQEAAFEYLAATNPGFDAKAAKQGLESEDRNASRDAAIQKENDTLEKARETYNRIFVERQTALDREEELLRRREELESQQARINSNLQQKKDIAGDTGYGAIEIQALESDLERVESNLNRLNEDLKKVPQKIAQIDAKGMAMSGELQKVIDSTATNIERINEQFDAEESAARSRAATEKIKEGVQALGEFVSQFDAITPQQQEAEANIRAALSDGKLTADEMVSISQSIKILQGSLKLGQQGHSENIQSLIRLMSDLITINKTQARDIEGLKKQFGKPLR